jgi:HPt (histidine-containing phosphotransfer) domain-containing protein
MQWDAAETLERLGGDERLLREVIQIFLEEGPKQMASIREALARGDKDSTERIAHTLKGELGYLGLAEASQAARELEDAGRAGDLERAARIQALLESDVQGVVASMRDAVALNSLAQSSGAN